MDEATAKTKWCPYKEAADVGGALSSVAQELRPKDPMRGYIGIVSDGGAGYVNTPPRARCIASDCMMWSGSGCGLVRS